MKGGSVLEIQTPLVGLGLATCMYLINPAADNMPCGCGIHAILNVGTNTCTLRWHWFASCNRLMSAADLQKGFVFVQTQLHTYMYIYMRMPFRILHQQQILHSPKKRPAATTSSSSSSLSYSFDTLSRSRPIPCRDAVLRLSPDHHDALNIVNYMYSPRRDNPTSIPSGLK